MILFAAQVLNEYGLSLAFTIKKILSVGIGLFSKAVGHPCIVTHSMAGLSQCMFSKSPPHRDIVSARAWVTLRINT